MSEMVVVLAEDDERFGLLAGDILVVEPYGLDPGCKLTVLRRVTDQYDPSCNVYRHQVRTTTGEHLSCSCCTGLAP